MTSERLREGETIRKQVPMTRIKPVFALALAIALLLAFLLQGAAFIRTNSQTFDEAIHLAAGYSYLATGDFRLNTAHPPLSKQLAALPLYLLDRSNFDPDPELWESAAEWKISRDFLYHGTIRHERALAVGRVPNLLLGAALIGLIGWWARRLWGTASALVAMALAAFDPNLIAHSSVITPDLPLSFFCFSTFYLCWEYANAPSRWRMLAVGSSIGCALASKHTAVVLLLPLCLAFLLADPGELPGTKDPRQLLRRLRKAGVSLSGILFVALLTFSVSYFFFGLPAWVTGLVDHFRAPAVPAFFLGEISKEGWWLYFPVAFVLKTPEGTLLMLALSLLLWNKGERLQRSHLLFIVLPPTIYFLAMALVRVNIGIRYLLPVYPFVFLLCSRLATVRFSAPVPDLLPRSLLIGLPIALSIGSSLGAAPHQLAYFNFLSGGPAKGASYLGDSNLDWGQDLQNLRNFLEKQRVPMVYLSYFGTAPPQSYGLRYQFLPGFFDPLQEPSRELLPLHSERELLAISVNNLQGTYLLDPNLYGWLRAYSPIARIGGSIYVYDLTGDAAAHRRLAQIYRRAGMKKRAEREEQRAVRARSSPQGSR
jgi:hypothetical protein